MGREPSSRNWWRIAGLVAGLVLALSHSALAQLTTQEEERLRILSDPESMKKKLDQKKDRPPFEFFKSQVAPSDVLPYVKANHWSTLILEMRANDDDYDGFLQSDPAPLFGMPIDMVFRRDARLLKEQRRALSQQVLLTKVPKEWTLSIVRPGALRSDAPWQAILTPMEPHQALIVVLSKDATTHFATWSRMTAMIPSGSERDNPQTLDKQRYYRVVLPTEPDKLALSSHPLTWTTISHVIWDGLPPDMLSVGQQQAILDWVHWGGQLIFTGGAGQSYALYRESFLGPYLPGEPTGQTVPLTEADLQPLAQSYPPPSTPFLPQSEDFGAIQRIPATMQVGRIYQPPAPIRPPSNKPVYLAVLRPAAGALTIPLGEASPQLLAVERRVGRGRITMLTINPTEPVLATWPGLDTMVRRVVLRRPEEGVLGPAGMNAAGYQGPRRGFLAPQDLTWYRIASRDARPGEDFAGHLPDPVAPPPPDTGEPEVAPTEPPEMVLAPAGVADWRDTSRFSTLSRDLLEEASGIKIPSSGFVLRVILAYLIAVVPLNWLLCRFVFNRREWAWIIVPLVAFGFAIGIQRGAAYDMGFESASDELDLLEVQGDYPRAHLTRFASIYTSGRGNYTISYPNNNTALALPLGTGRSIPGEDRTTSVWQSTPVPTLSNLTVQPRSLSLFRAEEMASMAGAIRLEEDESGRKVVNGSELELRDATLIDVTGPDREQWKERYLGTVAPGASVDLGGADAAKVPERIDAGPGPDGDTFLRAVRTTWERRDMNFGEIRLVAWVARSMPGQVIDPPPDRLRGFTAVLVHLRSGPPPSPDGEQYNRLALGPEKPISMNTPAPPSAIMRNSTRVGRSRATGRTKPGNNPSTSQ